MNNDTPTPMSNQAFDSGTLADENDALAFSRSLEIKLTLATQRIKSLEDERDAMETLLKKLSVPRYTILDIQ